MCSQGCPCQSRLVLSTIWWNPNRQTDHIAVLPETVFSGEIWSDTAEKTTDIAQVLESSHGHFWTLTQHSRVQRLILLQEHGSLLYTWGRERARWPWGKREQTNFASQHIPKLTWETSEWQVIHWHLGSKTREHKGGKGKVTNMFYCYTKLTETHWAQWGLTNLVLFNIAQSCLSK